MLTAGALTIALAVQTTIAFAAPAAKPNPVRPGEARVIEKGLTAKSFKDANYKGKFPAPEGIVLQGTIGTDRYKDPTGSGAYKFRVKTEGKRPLACLDSSRIILGSKGKNWDRGWFMGYDIAKNDAKQIIQIYNDKPRGVGVGNKLYDEGFRKGYAYSFNGGYETGARYDCRKVQADLTHLDEDGWTTYDATNAPFISKRTPSIVSASIPARPYGTIDENGKGMLNIPNAWVAGISSPSDDQKIEKANPKAPRVNLSHIEAFESSDADDQAMTAAQFGDALYKGMKSESEAAFAKFRDRICMVSEATVAEKTYGGQSYTLVTFYRSCTAKGKEAEWKLLAFALTKSPSTNDLVGFFFSTPNSIKKAGANEIDMTKFPSVPFIEQFLGKVVIK